MQVIYVYNPGRAHEILPLLGDTPVTLVKGWRDALALGQTLDAETAVIVDNFGRPGLLGVVVATLYRVPLVSRLRGEYFREERERTADRTGLLKWPRYFVSILLAKICLSRSRMAICNSEYISWAMKPYLRGKMVEVVYNPCAALEDAPVLSSRLSLPEKGYRLLTVTNMSLYSKVQPILEAISEWVPSYIWEELDINWAICGSGYHEERLRALIREKGLEQRVHLLGWIDGVSDLYKWCHVLVHFTRMDAFPNVTMEAMVRGRPVIINADSCGTREQVRDGENGLVVDSVEPFVSALRAYAADPAFRQRHGRKGHKLILENFSVDAQRPIMKHALEKLFRPGRGGSAA